MAARLEPVYLANVLLYIDDPDTITDFPFVSKRCREATFVLRVNPAELGYDPQVVLRLFPNINTLVVSELSNLDEIEVLPDTVTGIVVQSVCPDDIPDEVVPFVDRIVEIRSSVITNTPADFTQFSHLERLRLDGVPERVVLPEHRLRRLTVGGWDTAWVEPLEVFPPECAEQIVFVFDSSLSVYRAKEWELPPNVRIFSSEIGYHVSPSDFYPWPSGWERNEIRVTDYFGLAELRAFNEQLPIPYTCIDLSFDSTLPEFDISFLTDIAALGIKHLKDATLTLPKSVVELTLERNTQRVTLSGTENLVCLRATDQSVIVPPCPKLRFLHWCGKTLSEQTFPFPVTDFPALFSLNVKTERIDPGFRFPTQLKVLRLKVSDGSVDVALLTPLTRLQELTIDVDKDSDPLDLSGLTALTELDANKSPISQLPTSLVECTALLPSGFDCSHLTRLKRMRVPYGSN